MTAATHLNGAEAHERAEAALKTFWPGWQGDLEPLKPLMKPLRATPFVVHGGSEPAVVKVWGPGNADKAQAQARRQAEVAQAMSDGLQRAVPVLDFDAANCALLMAQAKGKPVVDVLRGQPDRLDELALRAGQWCRAHHQSTLRPAGFRPAGHKAWLERLMAQVTSGERAIPDAGAFVTEAERLTSLAMSLRKRPSLRAVTHRDLTLSNLILSDDGTLWGLDFENAKEDEPGRDLFSLALDLLRYASDDAARSACYDRLWAGYGAAEIDPEVSAFLTQCFALGLWANTPARPSQRQAERLAMAHWVRRQSAL
ncbi:Phosphotransferase enzyme family protein [Pelagimonas phthalicica]|uniref:Phosphotransferase enzyme family protein n=1 Tax=Pelagimonas phthalicica TaxID=1037362 RepID=A0A238JFI3_9RHOB|nr:phosphotransferase [Pelagimonas phthalicica]TDS91674.1 phosphotransferase family enzyme [Pelagimonas phthalicica]SMX28722.1 Phosphotransferase enzyme family protein [Pelagimonas phthalicica]